jgi:hypothetical protein
MLPSPLLDTVNIGRYIVSTSTYLWLCSGPQGVSLVHPRRQCSNLDTSIIGIFKEDKLFA